MSLEALFRPFACKSLKIPNRIALAPMARWAAPGGDPAPLGDFYRRRVEAGVGLVITEGATVARPSAGNDANSLKLHGPALESWPAVTAAVHDAGGAIAPQLWHCGATAKGGSDWTPAAPHESPSGLQAPHIARGRSMAESDIADVIAAYAQAARDARQVGFDALEIHCGHGYLLDQFLWDKTNLREDRWGGRTLAERSRFPLAVVQAVREAVGPDLALILRISQWKSADPSARPIGSPAELEAWLAPFVAAGIDMIHASQRRWDFAEFEGSHLSLAGWAKKLLDVPTIVVGGVGMSGDLLTTFGGETGRPEPVEAVAERLEAGEFDIVAVGRALLADFDWARKIRSGAPRSACTTQHLLAGVSEPAAA